MAMTKPAIAATLLAVSVPAAAEGLVFIPGQGWRAAPCCRENGYPGLQGVPPREFVWGEIVPRTLPAPPRMIPPPPMAPAPPRSMRLSQHAPVARAPMADEPEPEPEALPAPLPAVAPVAPAPMGQFEEFCSANPAAPPCRGRVRGQR